MFGHPPSLRRTEARIEPALEERAKPVCDRCERWLALGLLCPRHSGVPMPTRNAAHGVQSFLPRFLSKVDQAACGRAVRTQAAVLRALIDEVVRRPASEPKTAQLQAQVDDETRRLVRLLASESSTRPGASTDPLRSLG